LSVSTKLEVSTAYMYLLGKNRKHGTDGQTDGCSA